MEKINNPDFKGVEFDHFRKEARIAIQQMKVLEDVEERTLLTDKWRNKIMAENKFENAPWVRLGDYIIECNEVNSDGKYGLEFVRGVSNTKEFMKYHQDIQISV